MLTACAFWMMNISTTMRTAVPAISATRMLLIFVCIRLRAGARGAGGAAGAEPLADGGGKVPVGPDGALMACFLDRKPGSLATCGGSYWRPGRLADAADSRYLLLTYIGN